MARRNDEPTDDGEPLTTGHLSRRRLIQLTGVGIVGGAASVGSVSGAGTSTYPNTIVFDGTVSKGKSKYTFSVSDAVEADGDVGSIEKADKINGATVTGAVHRDKDAYRFSGNLTSLDVSGKAGISIQYGDEGDIQANRLEIVAGSSDLDYSFTASDQIVPVRDGVEYTANTADTVVENDDGSWTATGDTASSSGDTFDFWGDITDFEPMSGDFTLFLNGEVVSPYELTGEEKPQHTLEVVAPDVVTYTFTSTGEVGKLLDNGKNSAEGNDTITQNADGTWTVEGFTGNGYGDGFTFSGSITDFEILEGSCTIFLDGTEVTIAELTGDQATHLLEIVVNDSLDYTFTTTGEIEKNLDNGDNSAEGNDSVIQNDDSTWTADGFTGNGYGDAFTFTGSVTDFSPMDGNFALYLDGEQVTAYELTGEEKPADTTTDTVEGGPVGGGVNYPNLVTRDMADVVVSSLSELESALSSASAGDVVFVAGNASIDMGTTDINVPAGVTLASNRGVDDAPGGHLFTDEETKSIYLDDGARCTGLRVQGPFYEYFDPSWYASGSGVRATGSDVEIDNNEIWGFAYGSVVTNGYSPHVHHNHIHHNPRDGLGYGVVTGGGKPTIEWNYFNYNRHSVAASGSGGYTVRYNHFGPDTIGHVIDMHQPGGTTMEIYNNTVEAVTSLADGERKPAVAIRDVPDNLADIRDNWFYNDLEPRDSPSGWTNEAIIQVHVDSWTNVEWSNNQLGATEPSADIGCPR